MTQENKEGLQFFTIVAGLILILVCYAGGEAYPFGTPTPKSFDITLGISFALVCIGYMIQFIDWIIPIIKSYIKSVMSFINHQRAESYKRRKCHN